MGIYSLGRGGKRNEIIGTADSIWMLEHRATARSVIRVPTGPKNPYVS